MYRYNYAFSRVDWIRFFEKYGIDVPKYIYSVFFESRLDQTKVIANLRHFYDSTQAEFKMILLVDHAN